MSFDMRTSSRAPIGTCVSLARPCWVPSVLVDLRLRRATDVDSQFCFDSHEAVMGAVVAAVFGAWDHEVQRVFHERWFDPNRVPERAICMRRRPARIDPR